MRDSGPVHASPSCNLNELLTGISVERGSRIRCIGAVYEAWGFPELWVDTPDRTPRNDERGNQ